MHRIDFDNATVHAGNATVHDQDRKYLAEKLV